MRLAFAGVEPGVVARGAHDCASAGKATGAAMMVWRESGELKFEGDAEQLAAVCFSMTCDGPRIRSILGDPLSRSETERHAALAVDLFLRGLPIKKGRT